MKIEQDYSKHPITTIQFIIFIYLTQTGLGILTLPSQLHKSTGTSGWISIILGGLVTIIVNILIIKVMERFPNKTIFEIISNLFGTIIGKLFTLVWVLYSLLFFFTIIFSAIHIISVWILPKTSVILILLLFTVPLYIIVSRGLLTIIRYGEIIFTITLWMLPLLLFALKDAHWLNLLPIIKNGWIPLFVSAKDTFFSFLGFELIFLLYPFLENKTSAIKAAIIANSLTMFSMVFVTLISFLFFSPDEIQSYLWPTLNVLKTIEFPFLERFEIIYLPFYLFILSMTGIPYFYSAIFASSFLLNAKNASFINSTFLCAFIITGFFFNPDFHTLDTLSNWVNFSGLGMAFLFPILLLFSTILITKLKKGHRI
ncbi:spore germination protein [Bacillus timonensis]|nr:spore germination protein [Bacillus timonensis]